MAGSTGYLLNTRSNNGVVIAGLELDGREVSLPTSDLNRNGLRFNCYSVGGMLNAVTAHGFAGKGFDIYGPCVGIGYTYTNPCAAMFNIVAYYNNKGIQIGTTNAGNYAEYTTLTGFKAVRNWIGMVLDAGNVTVLNGHVDNNYYGLIMPGTAGFPQGSRKSGAF